MAIKQKVPSPQEVKNTPQSFTKQELDEIKKLRDNLSELTFQLGQLSIQKIKLEDQEKNLINRLNSLEEKETFIAKKITDKYGKGSIDLETGTFTPSS